MILLEVAGTLKRLSD